MLLVTHECNQRQKDLLLHDITDVLEEAVVVIFYVDADMRQVHAICLLPSESATTVDTDFDVINSMEGFMTTHNTIDRLVIAC